MHSQQIIYCSWNEMLKTKSTRNWTNFECLEMEVNPLSIILVKSDSKGDRLLFRYPFVITNNESNQKKKRHPYSLITQEDILQSPLPQTSNIHQGNLQIFFPFRRKNNEFHWQGNCRASQMKFFRLCLRSNRNCVTRNSSWRSSTWNLWFIKSTQ